MSDWIHRIIAPSAIVISAGAIPCCATTYLRNNSVAQIAAKESQPADSGLAAIALSWHGVAEDAFGHGGRRQPRLLRLGALVLKTGFGRYV